MKKETVALIYLGRRGGGPVYAYEMARGLINNGYSLYIFISEYVENISSWMQLDAKSIERIKTYNSVFEYIIQTIKFRFFSYKKLKLKYNNTSIDMCYVPMGHFWDDYIINLFPSSQIVSTIHDPIRHSSDQNIFEKIISIGTRVLNLGVRHHKPDDIIVLSSSFKDVIKNNYGYTADRIHVIPHGVFDFYKSVDAGLIHRYPQDKINFFFFGRICGYKGIDILASAYSMLKKKYSNISLTIVGSGDFSAWRNMYKDVDDVFVINRWIQDEEVASFFKDNKNLILVLPYKDATQSGVIPTAMSFEVPVIATNTGGLKEQIQDGKTGFLCNASDSQDLMAKMEYVMNNDNSQIVSNAYSYIESLNWDSLSKRVGLITNKKRENEEN